MSATNGQNYSNYLEGASDDDSPPTVVQLDGLVVLKIIKHCKENLPELVTGQLLGLDLGANLEVTNCFPFPKTPEDSDQPEETDSGAEYQIEMMRCLREVNVDNNTVGWYTSTFLGSFLNEAMIETQINYQMTIPKCVVVIFDPLRTKQGSLSLKACRLTDSFMEFYREQNWTQESLNKSGLSFNDIFQEIPIQIHNTLMGSALLWELEDSISLTADFDKLDLSTNPFLEKNLEFLIEYIDDLAAEQNRFQYWQRNAEKQALIHKKSLEEGAEEDENSQKQTPPPSRLDSLLITNQINSYCKQINQFSSLSFSKLFLFNSLNKDQ